jgi:hypothetical protein
MIMANEPVLWRGGPMTRRRDLAIVHHSSQLAEAEVAGIGRVTRRGLYEALEVNMVRAQAERIEPDGAEHYALLAAVGVTEMAQAIARARSGR